MNSTEPAPHLPTTPDATRIGVPYAPWDDKLAHKVCPVCNERFDTQRLYAEHYVATHREN